MVSKSLGAGLSLYVQLWISPCSTRHCLSNSLVSLFSAFQISKYVQTAWESCWRTNEARVSAFLTCWSELEAAGPLTTKVCQCTNSSLRMSLHMFLAFLNIPSSSLKYIVADLNCFYFSGKSTLTSAKPVCPSSTVVSDGALCSRHHGWVLYFLQTIFYSNICLS